MKRPCIECGRPTDGARCNQHQIHRPRGRQATATLNRVYQEAGGICHLCGEYVPRGEASTDHLIPLARGGTPTPPNERLAHISCNSSKGDGLNHPQG